MSRRIYTKLCSSALMVELCRTSNGSWDEGQHEEEIRARIYHEFYLEDK